MATKHKTRTFDENEQRLFPKLCAALAANGVEYCVTILGQYGSQITYNEFYEHRVQKILEDIYS